MYLALRRKVCVLEVSLHKGASWPSSESWLAALPRADLRRGKCGGAGAGRRGWREGRPGRARPQRAVGCGTSWQGMEGAGKPRIVPVGCSAVTATSLYYPSPPLCQYFQTESQYYLSCQVRAGRLGHGHSYLRDENPSCLPSASDEKQEGRSHGRSKDEAEHANM